MKRVFRMFADWSNDREQEWLSQMEAQGWRFFDRGVFGYWFKPCEPKAGVAYRMDFWPDTRRRVKEYFDIAYDAGWDHVHTHNGWHYFRRREGFDQWPEFFTDVQSVRAKYRRVVRAALAVWIPWATVVSLRIARPIVTRSSGLHVVYTIGQWGTIVVLLGMAHWILRMWMLMRRIGSGSDSL